MGGRLWSGRGALLLLLVGEAGVQTLERVRGPASCYQPLPWRVPLLSWQGCVQSALSERNAIACTCRFCGTPLCCWRCCPPTLFRSSTLLVPLAG